MASIAKTPREMESVSVDYARFFSGYRFRVVLPHIFAVKVEVGLKAFIKSYSIVSFR